MTAHPYAGYHPGMVKMKVVAWKSKNNNQIIGFQLFPMKISSF